MIDVMKDAEDPMMRHNVGDDEATSLMIKEPRSFMYCSFLHHPGLSTIQYKTFFHMCRLESISFDMEKRSGSTFCLYDSLQSGVIGMLTIGVHRKVCVNYMIDALNFIQNQAGVLPGKINIDRVEDSISVSDVVTRVRLIHRAFGKIDKSGKDETN